MAQEISRRMFLQSTAASAAASALLPATAPAQTVRTPRRPVVIASGNGLNAVAKAGEMIAAGSDTLDAVIAGVGLVEADPNDHSVGFGGLPNEDGVVELDASVMHGPTHNAGSVAALRNIVHPSQVAKLVMERTDHVMLVGEGALRFARAHGFKETDLLTEEARKIWLEWKESHSENDDWVPPAEAPDKPRAAGDSGPNFTYGTINCCAVNDAGDLSGVTTTSGLSYKIPGRIGDSPIIGAGLYVDNAVGAAGATGRGEAVILNSGAFAIVELMRGGKSPEEACLAVLQRISEHTHDRRLLRSDGRPNYQVTLYAVAKDGRYGSASMWSGEQRARFAIYRDGESRLEDTAFLYKS
jgi:N4-(beta-N-acetylglucosaminyl)-L-asparaginase